MRAINKLSATEVARKTKPGRYGDGGGLWLQVSSYGSKAWVFRYMLDGKARHMGLGSVDTFSLKEARERARLARQLVADGVDPIETKRAKRSSSSAASAKRITFKEAAERFIKAKGGEWRSPVHRQQWENTLATYAEPIIGNLSVAEIETAHIVNVLEPIWREKTETANRLRGRIEAVLNWATTHKYRSGENPARWRGHLQNLFPAKAKIAKAVSHPAMPYAALGGFMERLRDRDGVSARALEFTILSAARTGEVREAEWGEFDLDAKVWTIPAERMKARKEHRVPLSARAVELLKALPREGDYVFPGARPKKPLSDMAMLELLRGMEGNGLTVHGFRSTFREWAGEMTAHPREVIEHALAHQLADKAEAAYQRGSLFPKRVRLMDDWAKFCATKPPVGNVVGIGQARA